jgi:hypothetical protein
MSAIIEATEEDFSVDTRGPVLDWPYRGVATGVRPYDVSLDGTRFLALKDIGVEGDAPQIIVVENWFEELERLVPTE